MKDDYHNRPLGVLCRHLFLEFAQEDIEQNGGMDLQDIIMRRFKRVNQAINRYRKDFRPIPEEWEFEVDTLLGDFRYFLENEGIIDSLAYILIFHQSYEN